MSAKLMTTVPASRPAVSVLMGAYQSEETISCAIDSIRSQTETDLELIVIDDGSSDGSAVRAREAVAGDPRCQVLELGQNVGIASSLNVGLSHARAPVVAIQDADDRSEPERLERQLAMLAGSSDVAVVGGLMTEVDTRGRPLQARTSVAVGEVTPWLMRFNPIPNGVAAFRREVVLELGGYDARFRYAAEYDLWLRIAEHHRIVVLDQVLATRVMSAGNVAARAERAQTLEAMTIRVRAMRRRRSMADLGGLARPALSYVTPMPLKRALRRGRGQAP